MIRAPFLAIVASLLAAPAVLAQGSSGTGAPRLLPGDASVGPAGGVQQFPALAAGDGVYLAAWEDHRAASATLFTREGTRDLFARRIAADGTPLDLLPFRVSDAPGRKESVRVAFDGQSWLVAWESTIPTQFSDAIELRGVRVAADGSVLDTAPITIRSYAFSRDLVYALAADALGWALAVQGNNASEALVEGYRVAHDGTVTPAGTPPLLSGSGLWTFLDMHASGPTLLLAGSSGGIVQGQLLSSALAPLGAQMMLASGDCERPSVGSRGAGFLVAWHDSTSGYVVQARAVSQNGVPSPTMTFATSEDCYEPSVTWNGAEYVVAFSADLFVWPAGLTKSLRVARVSSGGTPIDGAGILVAEGLAARDPALASLGDGTTQLVWRRESTTPPHPGDVLGARVTQTAAGSAVELSTSTSRHRDPHVTPGGAGYLVAWASDRDGAIAILAQRLDRFGRALDAEPLELARGPALGAPRAAWNGFDFLVVWHDEIELDHTFGAVPTDDVVLGRRIGADGAPLDPAPFHVMDGATPDLAAVGAVFLVAARRADTTQMFRIYGTRVSGSGQVLDPTPLLIGGNYGRFPAVASFADRWLVAWQRNPTHDNPATSIYARVVLSDGSALPEAFVDGGSRPSAAASPATGLVSWSAGDVRAQRVSTTGALLGAPFVAGGAAGVQDESSVAWNGSAFAVAWQDARNATSIVDEQRDVFAGRVSEAGDLLDGPGGVPVAASAEDERTPAVAGLGGDDLFALALFVPGEPHATMRVASVRRATWKNVGSRNVRGHVLGGRPIPTVDVGGPAAPLLAGGGALAGGALVELAVSGAPPGRPGILVLGTRRADARFAGGVRVPSLDARASFVTGRDGTGVVSVRAPASLPPGVQLWAQCWVLDPRAPSGFVASNALTTTLP